LVVSLPKRDLFATLLVGVSLVVYVAWAVGIAVPGEVAGVALAVLLLGVVASVSAVVPAFAELVHGSRLYLGTASALGLAALVAGLWAVVAGEPTAVTVLVVATILLWAMSTMRHVGLYRPQERLGHR
jgi:hypothetical protein